MKIVIDIDDNYYEIMKHDVDNGLDYLPCILIAKGTPFTKIKITNREWVDFLSEQFNISRTSAKEMLHRMMTVKKHDNFKRLFSVKGVRK